MDSKSYELLQQMVDSDETLVKTPAGFFLGAEKVCGRCCLELLSHHKIYCTWDEDPAQVEYTPAVQCCWLLIQNSPQCPNGDILETEIQGVAMTEDEANQWIQQGENREHQVKKIVRVRIK